MAYCYGWTNEYIESLDVPTFLGYYKSIDVFEKKNLLSGISASISAMQKPQAVKKKVEKLNREIRNSFKTEISSVNAKYLAQEMLKNGR